MYKLQIIHQHMLYIIHQYLHTQFSYMQYTILDLIGVIRAQFFNSSVVDISAYGLSFCNKFSNIKQMGYSSQ